VAVVVAVVAVAAAVVVAVVVAFRDGAWTVQRGES
jgi:hypothetical protein